MVWARGFRLVLITVPSAEIKLIKKCLVRTPERKPTPRSSGMSPGCIGSVEGLGVLPKSWRTKKKN